jgi:hypothetical protein
MAHPLVLALFENRAATPAAARALRDLGIDRACLSVVCRTHKEEGELADQVGGTPGAEIEDSPGASWLGELSGHLLAAIALVLPGIGPIVSAGPLAADLGEAAGHMAGGIAAVLSSAGISDPQAADWQSRVRQGAVLLAVHTTDAEVDAVKAALQGTGADRIALAEWQGDRDEPGR